MDIAPPIIHRESIADWERTEQKQTNEKERSTTSGKILVKGNLIQKIFNVSNNFYNYVTIKLFSFKLYSLRLPT